MSYLLNLCYFLLLLGASPWIAYSALFKSKYREGWAAKVLGLVPSRDHSGPCVWLHAVSVGEVNLLQSLVDRFQERHPEWTITISTTTKTGYDLACQRYSSHQVFYCPLDFSWAVSRAMRRIGPDMLLLAELELWPNLIRAAKRHGASVAVVNGRLSESSFRGYSRIRPVVRQIMRQLDLVAVQNEQYAARFLELGAARDAVHVTGSTKFDGAEQDRGNSRTAVLARLAGIEKSDLVLLAGSTQAPEEQMVLKTYLKSVSQFPSLRLILVPRHPHRFAEVARILDQSGVSWARRSELSESESTTERVLLVDAVGELGAWWGAADIGFVGGSMGSRGGQNMIEPAAYGVATCFGPNTRNFRDIVQLLTGERAAIVVNDEDQFEQFVSEYLRDTTKRNQLGSRARTVVRRQLGAVGRTFDLLEGLMCEGIATPRGKSRRPSHAGDATVKSPHLSPASTLVRRGS